MPRSFPTPLELLQRYVDIRSDIRTPEGRLGYRQIIEDIRDMVDRWGLGTAKIREFDGGPALAKGEPRPANLTVDIGDGEEFGVWYSHADVIHASMYTPPSSAYHLKQRSGQEGIYEGCGSLDMKAGMVAEICALQGIEKTLKKTNRRIRMLVVYAEEEDSDGMHAARPLVRNADWAISTEISVDSKLGNNGHLLYARPGRACYHVQIDALETGHLGKAKSIPKSNQVGHRLHRAIKAIENINFHDPYKEKDTQMPDSYALAHTYGVYPPSSFTTANKGYINVEVLYTSPKLELPEIEGTIRDALRKVLNKRGFSVDLSKRPTPYIKPWYEEQTHPLVQAGYAEASRVLDRQATLSWGLPVAEEGIFSDERVPIITFPPDGEGEHTNRECVSVPYLEQRMIPFLQNMAATRHPLVKKLREH